MSNIQPNIISVKELLQTDNVIIPSYQRPYKWTAKNVNQLIDDIIYHNDKSAYRLGTLVIHSEISENNKTILNIVDGQQRTLTLTLIAHAITLNCTEKLKDKSVQGENSKQSTFHTIFSVIWLIVPFLAFVYGNNLKTKSENDKSKVEHYEKNERHDEDDD
jgi:uncharacterized protein with ParB-like and HNH nuclease domain